MKELNFAPARVERKDLAGGAFVLRSPMRLDRYPTTLCEHLEYWAEKAPNRSFLVERDSAGAWRKISYSRALGRARSVAQALLDRKIPPDRTVMIISGNSIDHALMMLGCQFAGIVASPVSPQYALASGEFSRLAHVFDVLAPSVVYVSDGQKFAGALAALDLEGVEVVASGNPPSGTAATLFETLLEREPMSEVDQARAALKTDTIAKILFTSGSTGMPKGVINTHRMLCSNQQALAQVWPFLVEKPPILVDWLPWSHTFGSNHNFYLVLRNGGTMYIDAGKPIPGLFDTSVANLKAVAPTIYFNVPVGYGQLVPVLEADAAFRDHFFSRLDTLFYAAASLPQNLWERLENLSIAALGRKIAMTSAWGSTETAPLATGVHFRIDRAGVMGLPVPGTELKMVPNAGKMEIRVRGPNVTPGYYKRPDLTKEAFDRDGFYRIGDAATLADPDDASKGIIFDGRVAEDFKLLTGSWVSVGMIRVAAISAADPMIRDAVVTGHDRAEIGLLIFPNEMELARVADLPAGAPQAELFADHGVRDALRAAIAGYNRDYPASSRRIARALIVRAPPDPEKNEITDKGYINQRAVIENRADLVDRLYSDNSDVIVMEQGSD